MAQKIRTLNRKRSRIIRLETSKYRPIVEWPGLPSPRTLYPMTLATRVALLAVPIQFCFWCYWLWLACCCVVRLLSGRWEGTAECDGEHSYTRQQGAWRTQRHTRHAALQVLHRRQTSRCRGEILMIPTSSVLLLAAPRCHIALNEISATSNFEKSFLDTRRWQIFQDVVQVHVVCFCYFSSMGELQYSKTDCIL